MLKPLKITSITEQEYLENSECLEGYCTTCREFTTSSVEPDAEEYSCEQCDKKTVYGTEQALLMGLIDIS
jgi:CO dehydrogenase/acetyl-CoA synthase gamma subunit (corrinoid Fe-S protein)